ncbi:response regulator transcription factor [Mucilaginibacter mali]|uniref:Response regulator transcription factor n=1 Tax=Mucilaginibacter mali TaxID=2740462 RepID=A0A7D4QP33_9SPHI|nr:LytTR family DNA-binding domain-containing protein [Mucilaginibacter mali]QKJ28329.1 response regulator transcription factor [Mucilaginibacter mali]
MTCYIIDDEQHAIDTLSTYLSRVPDMELAGTATNPVAAIQSLKAHPNVDVIFLDVDMPDISGIEAIELLPKGPAIVFTTAHSNYALNAFEQNAIDFLLKPISFAKFLKSIDKIKAYLGKIKPEQTTTPVVPPATIAAQSQTSMFINPGTRGKVQQIYFSEILYIEGLKNYVLIYTASGGKYTTYLTMNEIMTALPEIKFVRTHKSFIVNIDKIVSVDGNSINLVEQNQIPLGTSYRENFMNIISGLIVKTQRKA